MGGAAYRRGSRVISAQFCRDRGCSGCSSCSDPTPTPRPPGWGGKTAAMALKRARGLVNYWESRERGTPSPEDLADMIQMGLTCGRKTAEAAARAALDGRA